jgi:hypothetical protein
MVTVDKDDGRHPLEVLERKATGIRDGRIVKPQRGDGIVAFDMDMGRLTGFMAVEEEPEGPFPVEGGSHGASMNIRLLLLIFHLGITKNQAPRW